MFNNRKDVNAIEVKEEEDVEEERSEWTGSTTAIDKIGKILENLDGLLLPKDMTVEGA
jgi:hypothetical protein